MPKLMFTIDYLGGAWDYYDDFIIKARSSRLDDVRDFAWRFDEGELEVKIETSYSDVGYRWVTDSQATKLYEEYLGLLILKDVAE